MTNGTRRAIVALAFAAPLMLALALLLKLWDGPDWVVVVLASIGMSLIGLVLLLADAVTCVRETREAARADEIEMTYAGGGAWPHGAWRS